MSNKVPIISVTSHKHHSSSSSESDSDSSESNDMDYGKNWGALTDVEDFDSQAEFIKLATIKPSADTLAADYVQQQNDVTDIEDYVTDSDSDIGDGAKKNPVYPELNISLQEFLHIDDHEQTAISNEAKEKIEHRKGNFLQAQNLSNLNDYLTDCEDYNTDSELENDCAKSVCVDFNDVLIDQGRVNIADATVSAKESDISEDDYEEVSVASNVSDMASAMSDVDGRMAHGVSEDELLEMSGDEEICQIAFSDSDCNGDDDSVSEEDLLSNCSLPPLDVTFVSPSTPSVLPKANSSYGATIFSGPKKFLDVSASTRDEVLTDVERLDDDDEDSFDDDEKPIPQAVILAPGDDGGCVTDCEDLICEDVIESDCSSNVAASVDLCSLPQPQREVVMLQEDKYGDTITSIIPMDKEYQFGISCKIKEECVTDTEEYSCGEDEGHDLSIADDPMPPPSEMVEGDITIANEQLKPHQSKRLEIQSNTESVTDIEEIYMDGTNSRRKKLKTRSMSKGKSKHLETPKTHDDGGTDIEDIDLSDSGLPIEIRNSATTFHIPHASPMCADKTTDVEDITNDDVSSVSETELPQIDVNSSNLKDYETSSANVVVALETCGSVNCSKHKKFIPSTFFCSDAQQANQQQQTDIEDVQLPSDTEEYIADPATAYLCNELSDMLNESCTTVHETCSSSFNVDAEKLHIKETLQEYIPETQIVSVESVTRQGTITYDTVSDKYRSDDVDKDDAHSAGGGGNGDDDNDDDDEDDDDEEEEERDESVIDTDSKAIKSNQLENVRREATDLVDRVLHESVHIVNEHQGHDRTAVHEGAYSVTVAHTTLGSHNESEVDNNNRQENNSDSDNYAITCDVVGGLDVIKSPTIESMSGKSFDDNLSSSDDHMVTLPHQQQQQHSQQQQHHVGPQETPSQSGDDIRGTTVTVKISQSKEFKN